MTDDQANQLRLHANQIMWNLHAAGQVEQLKILKMYAESAVEDLSSKATEDKDPIDPYFGPNAVHGANGGISCMVCGLSIHSCGGHHHDHCECDENI